MTALPDGVQVVLDPGTVLDEVPAAVRDTVLARTTVWTGNREESEALAGVGGILEAAEALGTMLPGDAVVVVRDGPRGCLLLVAGRATFVAGFPQRPVDTNGAGDTHTGVLLAERLSGRDWPEAALRANAAGALKVTRRGPETAPRRDEVEAFLREHLVDGRG